MKNNQIALKKVKNAFIDDRICSNAGLCKLIKTEIVNALASYIEIDPTESSLSVEITESGAIIDCHIHALTIKRFGLNY